MTVETCPVCKKALITGAPIGPYCGTDNCPVVDDYLMWNESGERIGTVENVTRESGSMTGFMPELVAKMAAVLEQSSRECGYEQGGHWTYLALKALEASGIAELTEALTLTREWLMKLADADLDESAADGVTVGMVFQQEARQRAAKLAKIGGNQCPKCHRKLHPGWPCPPEPPARPSTRREIA